MQLDIGVSPPANIIIILVLLYPLLSGVATLDTVIAHADAKQTIYFTRPYGYN